MRAHQPRGDLFVRAYDVVPSPSRPRSVCARGVAEARYKGRDSGSGPPLASPYAKKLEATSLTVHESRAGFITRHLPLRRASMVMLPWICPRRQVKLRPSDPDSWNALGHCYWKKPDLSAAKRCFMKALEKVSRSARGVLGRVLRRPGPRP